MARTPFKLRSGNTTPFKKMGSSPVKQEGEKKTLLGGIEKIISSFGDFLGKSGGPLKPPHIKKSLDKKYGGKPQTTDKGGKKIGEGDTQQERSESLKKNGGKKESKKEGTTNFGITTGMSFKQAFKQAGVGGAKEGDIFEWKGNKYKYEFKK